MKFNGKKLLLASSVAAALVIYISNNSTDDTISMDLRLMETTDIHTNIMPYNYFLSAADNNEKMQDWGLARTAIVINNTRDEVDNHMLFDNGDLIQGSPMGDYMANLGVDHVRSNTHPVYKAMNALNYDAANLGNHEFNYGLDYLDETLKGSNFPYVSANVWKYDNSLTKVSQAADECEVRVDDAFYANAETMYAPYEILTREFTAENGNSYTVNVGVIGFTPPDIMGWDATHLKCNVLVSDIKKTAEYFVPKMKAEGADIIVAIPHSGLTDSNNEFAENATLQLAYVDDIDALMFGHDHREFPNTTGEYGHIEGVDPEAGTINGKPAIMPGMWGAKLGVIDLKLTSSDKGQTWAIASSTTELRSLVEDQSDKNIEAAVEKEHLGTIEYMSDVIAQIDSNVNSFFPQLVPDLSMQIVNEAQYHQLNKWKESGEFENADDAIFLSVSAPFKSGRNGPTDFTNIQEGELTNASVADLYVFDNNTPAVLKLTGADLKNWIDWISSNTYNQLPLADNETFLVESYPGYNFDVFYGGFNAEQESRLHYVIDVTAESAFTDINGMEYTATGSTQVVSLTFDGAEIADEQVVYVVTNNYRASTNKMPGVDNAKVVKEEAAFNNRELVQYYLSDLLEEQEGETKLEFVNAKNFTLVAEGIKSVNFASATTDEAFRCAAEITGLSTNEELVDKNGTPGFTTFSFNFDYSGNFDCAVKQD
ncbi:bifunctional metallophosphatase/5'-nucleotidase [Vibrio sp. 10N.286.49.B3]|uniref:bifunctional 2',3'-cyclic-nucleotide 2'-phosphodiesterase/3'-nucleotidase n=1 Tax=Vibrio sp. 10N.286.49.B3 TaxID=1880855 RepID=UPI000C847DD8|nr:bifunctional 2',3'-cyclic-nucleotide 2'-phosphodiesterase/3'-nucleotidase [Vibrio sp. 10N.286.49.B3]PMH44640.1 bifunctional metallophosphatase/5'-nucleotidase [Vibrio sp. 10N.286.49.B3]